MPNIIHEDDLDLIVDEEELLEDGLNSYDSPDDMFQDTSEDEEDEDEDDGVQPLRFADDEADEVEYEDDDEDDEDEFDDDDDDDDDEFDDLRDDDDY